MVPCRGCHAKENCVRQSCLFVCLFVGFFIVLYYRNGIFQPRRRWFLLSNDAKKKSKSKPNYWPRPFVAERVGRYSQKKNYGEFFLFSFLASALFEGLLFRFLFLFSFSFVRCCASRAKAIEWNKKNMKPQSVLITLMNIM